MRTAQIALLIVISGCTSSGVLPLGPDTYTISTSNELSPVYAKKAALTDASRYCGKQGKFMIPLRTRQASHIDSFGDGIATYDFEFRCVEKDDPEFQRPDMQKEADVVVETRER